MATMSDPMLLKAAYLKPQRTLQTSTRAPSSIKSTLRIKNFDNRVTKILAASNDDISSIPETSSHISTLKEAAHTRKVPAVKVFESLRALEKAKLDSDDFLPTLGGSKSPGNTWMLVFTASSKDIQNAINGSPGGGSYFPITAIQRFDAEALEIENGVFFGPLGYLTFKGPFGWKGRRLSFTFNTLTLKLGSLKPFEFNIGKKEDEGRTPGVGKEGSKDPFFTWFFIDEEIAAARGRGGGSAFWVRCEKVQK